MGAKVGNDDGPRVGAIVVGATVGATVGTTTLLSGLLVLPSVGDSVDGVGSGVPKTVGSKVSDTGTYDDTEGARVDGVGTEGDGSDVTIGIELGEVELEGAGEEVGGADMPTGGDDGGTPVGILILDSIRKGIGSRKLLQRDIVERTAEINNKALSLSS